MNQVNDIRATAFYITQDSSSSEPLTELVVPLGETVEFIIVGPLYTSDTVFGNIGGVRLNATNTDGILSFEHIEQRFTPAVATWPNTTYDDLNQTNATIGEFRQASADFLFNDVPVNLSQVASDVKGLMSSPDALEVTGTNPAARLEITNNTLQSELSLTLGALGISVDGVAIMPMTSADYVQGGITAVTADTIIGPEQALVTVLPIPMSGLKMFRKADTDIRFRSLNKKMVRRSTPTTWQTTTALSR